jgi:hypothetical protein
MLWRSIRGDYSLTTDLRVAARRTRPLTEAPIEFTSAVYPYDAEKENITGLFAYANKHLIEPGLQ